MIARRITMLEAGAEPDRGQQAVVEVILEPDYSDQFPDTVYEGAPARKTMGAVSSSHGRTGIWTLQKPAERVKRNVKAVLDGETQILPFKTMYFSLEKENGHIQCVIGNHVFCNQTYNDRESRDAYLQQKETSYWFGNGHYGNEQQHSDNRPGRGRKEGRKEKIISEVPGTAGGTLLHEGAWKEPARRNLKSCFPIL